MRVLLFPAGSSGDVHPFIGIGKKLLERGHEVYLFASEYFHDVAIATGLKFVRTATTEEYFKAQNDPNLWHPSKAFKSIFQSSMMLESYARQKKNIEEYYQPNQTIVVNGGLAMGVRSMRDLITFPLVTILLQPAVILSTIRPSVYANIRFRSWWPPWFRKLLFSFGSKLITDPVISPGLNSFRREIGLKPAKNILTDWWHSPDLNIGLFPEWYAPPATDWPKNLKLTGFPLFDESDVKPLPPQVNEYLSSGSPPIIATFGTAMRFAKPYFSAVAQAAEKMGRRAILLTPYREQIPESLPSGVVHFDYVPLSEILPRSAILIHHGGIGTASQAMKSATPQLIMPMAHDQPDNADRLKRLGVGSELRPADFNTENLIRELENLDRDEIKENCQKLANLVKNQNPVAMTCELIEGLLNKS